MGSKKGKSEADHVSNLSAFLKPVWESLRARLVKYPGTCFCSKQDYISWKLGDKIVCYIYFQKKNLRLNILRGPKKGADKKSKGFFTFDESREVAEEQCSNLESGEIECEYRIRLNNRTNLDDVMFLLEQKHRSLP